MGWGKRCATRHRLKGCDLLWLLIIEQDKILLLQSHDRIAGCIGNKNVQDDVVLGPIRAFSDFCRSGNELDRWIGRGRYGLPWGGLGGSASSVPAKVADWPAPRPSSRLLLFGRWGPEQMPDSPVITRAECTKRVVSSPG